MIDIITFATWCNQPILHNEDMWNGKYKTYGEMWIGENYTITNSTE